MPNRSASIILFSLLIVLSICATLSRDRVYRNSLTMWQDVALKSPLKSRVHYNLGNEWKNVGDLEAARLEWERAVELNPRYSQALNQLGNFWLLKHRYSKAEQYYSRALKLDSGNVEACFNYAVTLAALGKMKDAVFYYKRFLVIMTPEYQYLEVQVKEQIRMLEENVP